MCDVVHEIAIGLDDNSPLPLEINV